MWEGHSREGGVNGWEGHSREGVVNGWEGYSREGVTNGWEAYTVFSLKFRHTFCSKKFVFLLE